MLWHCMKFSRFLLGQKQSAWRRFPINRDKCGANHYWLRSPNELSDLQMSATKVRNKNETAKFFGDFFIPQHHFPLFDTTKGGMIYFHRFSHPCYAFRRWADTWVTPLLSGEIGVFRRDAGETLVSPVWNRVQWNTCFIGTIDSIMAETGEFCQKPFTLHFGDVSCWL